MAIKQQFTAPGQTAAVLTPNVAYFLTFTGTSFSAQLEVQLAGTPDWLPAAAAVTATMTFLAFIGKSDSPAQPLSWRWNVTAVTTGTVTVYLG